MDAADGGRVYTVSQVNRLADGLLNRWVFWVEGEISNFRKYNDFAFFSLCERDSVLPCVMFREALDRAPSVLQDGMSVLARGRLGIYSRRGQYRMNVYEVREAGEGRLRREFMRLMRKLAAEGLFDDSLKKSLPSFPDSVGLVTSLEGAAVRDVITNLTRRFPGVRLVVRGVRVQGEGAAEEIVEALEIFNRAFPVDVIILARGGGSLEDLQPFNTEEVVRAVRSSSVPVVTGVGHEPDVTLCDLAADVRASTPTGAALAAVPSRKEMLAVIREKERALKVDIARRLTSLRRDVEGYMTRRPFSRPETLLEQWRERVAETEEDLVRTARLFLESRGKMVLEKAGMLFRYPREYRDLPVRLRRAEARLCSAARSVLRLKEREPRDGGKALKAAARGMMIREEGKLSLLSSRLHALSPLAVLARGYSIVTREGETRPIRDSAEVKPGDRVEVMLHRGGLECEVTEVRPPGAGTGETAGWDAGMQVPGAGEGSFPSRDGNR
jgi:exodeoxyribonuclease VII large subunit